MKTFILIIAFKFGPAGGATSVEFSSLETCEAARLTVIEEYESFARGAFAVCVEK